MLCSLSGVSQLYDILHYIDKAVGMAVEAYKTANIGSYNSLESSKGELSSEELSEIITYIVSKAYLKEDVSPNLYL